MMKRSKMLALFLAGLIGVFSLGLTSCSSDTTVAPDNTSAITASYSTFDLMGEPVDFYDGTMATPMMERPDPNTDKGSDKRVMRTPFSDLLKHLKLDDRQGAAVKEMLTAHAKCVHAAIEILRSTGKDIIAAAKAERQAIIEKAKAGEITREEAAAAIHDLNKRTREALRNSVDRERVREMMKACDDEFLRSLASILTDEQLTVLRQWMAKRDARGSGDKGPGDRGHGDKGPGDKDTTGGRDTTTGGRRG
jgi:Spy/CpxP family protein refolding chaperone